MENKLADCRQKLAQLKQDFDQFVYLVSHDLNAPIRAISNLSGWIAEDLGTDIPPEVNQHVHLLQQRTRRLEGMLQAILALSRIGRTDLDKAEITFPEFLEDICNQQQAEGVVFDIQKENIKLTTYWQKLKTVLEELIQNAIKHSVKEDTKIKIRIIRLPQFLEIKVSDNGQGIKPEMHDKVFTLFFTAKGKEVSEDIGVGLTLVKHILEFVGGRIDLENNIDGTGSSFTVQWPLDLAE